jgi:hypothetical protein
MGTYAGGIVVMAVVASSSAGAGARAASLPPDPERPNNSKTCEEALARVKEAGLGSPLVSAERNRELFLEALAVAERLCAGK